VTGEKAEFLDDIMAPIIKEMEDPEYDFEESGDYQRLQRKYQKVQGSIILDGNYYYLKEGESSDSIENQLGKPISITEIDEKNVIWEYDFCTINISNNKVKSFDFKHEKP
jgi:hypothetical protein